MTETKEKQSKNEIMKKRKLKAKSIDAFLYYTGFVFSNSWLKALLLLLLIVISLYAEATKKIMKNIMNTWVPLKVKGSCFSVDW